MAFKSSNRPAMALFCSIRLRVHVRLLSRYAVASASASGCSSVAAGAVSSTGGAVVAAGAEMAAGISGCACLRPTVSSCPPAKRQNPSSNPAAKPAAAAMMVRLVPVAAPPASVADGAGAVVRGDSRTGVGAAASLCVSAAVCVCGSGAGPPSPSSASRSRTPLCGVQSAR